MRFDDGANRLAACALLAVLAGCASVTLAPSPGAPSPSAPVGAAVVPATASPPPGPTTKEGAGSAAASRVAEAVAPVDATAQRAFDAARQALAAGRRDEAERGFLALTKSHPGLGGPHANLGLLHLQADKPVEAVAALELAVKASPTQPQYLDQLGIAYRHAGQFDKARLAYEQAIAADATYAPALLNLGVLYDLYLWDAPRALEHYDRYLALTTDNDDKVKRWVAELRKRTAPKANLASREGRP